MKSVIFAENRRKGVRVSLPELAQIWLKYNEGFAAQEALGSALEPEREGASETLPGPAERRFFFQKALSEFFEPYRFLFESQEAGEGFLGVLELLDLHGNSPSVVMAKSDSEADELYGVSGILQKVALREHSMNVARIMLRLIKETYRDYENLIPKALVCSFGHDLGKIPALRESALYAKADHPLIGAEKLGEIFSRTKPSWLPSALDSVRDHHRASRDPFTLLLKEADSRAREAEIAALSKELKAIEWAQWFDVKRLLEILRPEVNIIQKGRRWKAFSFGSLVYCQPDFLYEGAKKLASEKKILDMKLLRISDKEQAIRRVVESLRKADALSNDVREPYWGRQYEIQAETFRQKMFLVPVKIEAFGVPHDIERAKEGYLRIIQSVAPVRR